MRKKLCPSTGDRCCRSSAIAGRQRWASLLAGPSVTWDQLTLYEEDKYVHPDSYADWAHMVKWFFKRRNCVQARPLSPSFRACTVSFGVQHIKVLRKPSLTFFITAIQMREI